MGHLRYNMPYANERRDKMGEMISLVGLNKAAVLAALYNASRPQGMGFMHYDPASMTAEEAEALLSRYGYFDYLKGRVMKVDLSGDSLDTCGYDRDNGQGAAKRAVDAMMADDNNSIRQAHQEGKAEAAAEARAIIDKGTTSRKVGGMRVVELGLPEELGPIIDAILE
jgi:hypothetical protein